MASSSCNATNDLCLLESRVQSEVHRLSTKSLITSKKQTSDMHIRYDTKTGKRVQQDKPRRKTKRKAVQVVQSDVGQQHVQYMHCQIHNTTSFSGREIRTGE